ncbi:MAG: membrane protein [Paracoccaceae bacterium]|nr:MAG: hypothetical protein D6686_07200 [Alphaproteobacteria bacterium]GIX15329.1 MAG: membrane protein [Paracoccaceae bacterium]
MLADFLLRAGLAGLGVALAAAPLGCFVVWRRMAYFGDATAHAALLGAALALVLDISLTLGVLVMALAMAAAVTGLARRLLAPDSVLGVAAHGALALGLVLLALTGRAGVDVEALLFGDVLAVGWSDLLVIWAGAAAILGLVLWRWSRLLCATVSSEIACAEGIDPARERLALAVAAGVLVAVAIKVVGALLVTAMLVIPAAAARPLARTPEAMALAAALIAAGSVGAGLGASVALDLPPGPAMVTAAAAAFAAGALAGRLWRRG